MSLDEMTSTELHKWVLNYPVVREAAAFLDGLADRGVTTCPEECRAMAKKLRGD
jgi:hypothetical protein